MNTSNIPAAGPEAGSSGVLQPDSLEVKPIAFQVAASILFISSALSLVGLALGERPNVIGLSIDVLLAFGLVRLNAGARNFTLVRAYAGAVLWPICFFTQVDILTASLLTAIQWAYCGSLILLLQGKTRDWKLYLAGGIFVVFVLCAMLGLYFLVLVGRLAR